MANIEDKFMIKKQRGRNLFKAIGTFFVVAVLLSGSLVCGLLYVLYHFLIKLW